MEKENKDDVYIDKILEISEILSKIDDKMLINDFFKCFLTKTEITEISKRWELVKLLEQGVSQRNIAKTLGISLCKITRGSKELKNHNSSLKKIINLLEKNNG